MTEKVLKQCCYMQAIRRISRDHIFADCFICQNCNTLETALKEDHLTCFKRSYNKIIEPDINQLCIDASETRSPKVVKYLISLGETSI